MTDWLSPPDDVVEIVDADPTPLVQVSPDGRRLLQLTYRALPPLEQLAEPMIGLAGVRFHPRIHQWRRPYDFTGYEVTDLETGAVRKIETPPGARLGRAVFSPDGRRIAFGNTTEEGVELWVGDPVTGRTKRLLDRRLNQTMGGSSSWWAGKHALIVLLVDPDRGEPPAAPRVPPGPRIEESVGRQATHRTWHDLLVTAHDEALFDHYLTGQLARVDLDPNDGAPTVTELGRPGVFLDAAVSPDGGALLVERVLRPYPHDVPLYRFAHTIELWEDDGAKVRTVATLPVSDEVPIQGVPVGPRAASWQPLEPATLLFVEALDGGDPRKDAEHRDRLLRLRAPFDGEPVEVARTTQRFVGVDWLERPGLALISEWDRDKRWVRTLQHDLSNASFTPRVVFDRSIDDRYGDPGQPVRRRTADGSVVARMDGDSIFLVGDGATAEGDRPFLDRFDLETGARERLFQDDPDWYAGFVQFTALGVGPIKDFVIRRESATTPPNFLLVDGRDGSMRALTNFADPHPQLTGIEKTVLVYERNDGVKLSGTLYLPPGRKPGERLPLVLWAYPHEYTDQGTASQVKAQPNRFTRLGGTSPLMFLTQGYAVLEDATMPVVGDPATCNDTFVEQIVESAKAAIDACAARGDCDPERVGVGGHSYGAFMTANLLAHSDLFRAGVARSGAYNRTLTPFGFQSERRPFWEAKESYRTVSPFEHAESVKVPLLLVHGEKDDNPGTFPLQSERMYHALSGLGATTRLVVLPHEGHGYSARESVLHVLAESFRWFERFVKAGPSS